MDVVALIIVLVIIVLIAGSTAVAGILAAPYVPTRQADVERMLQLVDIKPGQTVIDLGAGDGRFLVTAAKKYRARAIGYEISLPMVLVSRLRILLSGTGTLASIRWRNFFHQDLSEADVVVCFLTPGAMKKLQPKFDRELRAGTWVASYAFSLPGWVAEKKDKPNPKTMAIFIYRKK